MAKHEKKHDADTHAEEAAGGVCGGTCGCKGGARTGRGRVCRDERFWFGFMTALALAGAVFYAVSVRGGMGMGGAATTSLSNLSPREQMTAVAKGLGVDTKKFDACMAAGTHKDLIQKGMGEAAAAGASGTPFSVLMKDGKTVTIKGAYPQAEVERMIKEFDTLPDEKVTVPAVTDADHVRGAANATFTIVEYSDIDCPYCKRFHKTMQDVVAKNADVRWVYRHLPLAQLHPDAPMKAEATECAAALGGSEGSWYAKKKLSTNDTFWNFLDKIATAEQE